MNANVIEWEKIEQKTVIPGFHGKFAHSANMTFVLWKIDKGAVLPEHSHVHEQVVHVLRGRARGDRRRRDDRASRRNIGVIPSNAVHSGRALTDCRVMDAFYPLREDYMKGGAQSVLQSAMQR